MNLYLFCQLVSLLRCNILIYNVKSSKFRLNLLRVTRPTLLTRLPVIFIFCFASEIFNNINSGGKKKGGKKTKDDDFTWDWDSERLKSVTLLYNLLQLPLNPLFDPPMMEEEVVTQLASTCFKILENPVMAFQNKRDVRLSIIQVLGTMNKK